MQSMVVLLASGLFSRAACEQHLETYDRFSSPVEAPLLSGHGPVYPPKSLASPAFDSSTVDEVHYAPEFREFHNLVPTNFINMDRRFTHPSGFYYRSTLYVTESPQNSFPSFPIMPYGYHSSYNYPPQVYEPGGDSHNNLPSDFQPLSQREIINRYKGNLPQLYPKGKSYAPSSRDHQLVYEPLVSAYQPNQLAAAQPTPSTSPNIIRSDETSTRGTILKTNDLDVQNHPFYHTPLFYNPINTTIMPQYVVTTASPPVSPIGETYPSTIPFNRIFVPSLFDTHSSPPSSVSSDSPNIIRGETTPSTTLPSTNINISINKLIPTHSPDMTLVGLFTPRMFTPSHLQMIPPRDSSDIRSRQPHVVFEAPGHDNPK